MDRTDRSNAGIRMSVNLLDGPIMRSLIIFMIPLFLSNAFQQIYNAVDTAIVGHFLGDKSERFLEQRFIFHKEKRCML